MGILNFLLDAFPKSLFKEQPALGRRLFSRDSRKIKGVMTEFSRSKYMPHYGKKEAAKYAERAQQKVTFASGHIPTTGADERRHLVTIGGTRIPDLPADAKINYSPANPTWPTPNDNPGVLSADHRERIGQTVTWTSNAKAKTGEIVEVVPSGEVPKVKDASSPRDHISYVVQVGKVRYWPRVSLLNAVGV